MSHPGPPVQSPPALPGLVQQAIVDLPGARATMPPITAAGVELAKIVLGYIAAAMVLLLVIITVVEVIDATHEYSLQDNIAQQAARISAMPDAERLEAWRAGLKSLAATPSVPPTTDQQNAWRFTYDSLRMTGAASQLQAATLSACVAPVASKPQAAQLTNCDDVLAMLANQSRGAAGDLDKIRLLAEFNKEVGSSHQNTRTFWLQIAQMILLNLLLPILTALLGYIFGTHQVPAEGSDKS